MFKLSSRSLSNMPNNSTRRLKQMSFHLTTSVQPTRSYKTLETGSKYTASYTNHLVLANGQIGSYFHDVPLGLSNYTCSAVIEIPRYSNAKFEINKSIDYNPITQDVKKNKPRFVKNLFPFKGYMTNYGSIPQTWDDPTTEDPETGLFGDNDPLDIVEIGSQVANIGDIVQVKVLGALALIDDGELDWKIIGINVQDEMACQLNDIKDVDVFCPGLLAGIKGWFRDYKIPDGKGQNQFAFKGQFLDKTKAVEVIEHSHGYWQKLIQGVVKGDKIPNSTNSTVVGSSGHVKDVVTVQKIVDSKGNKEQDGALPADVNKVYYAA